MFNDHKDISALVVTGEGSTEAGNNEAQQIISAMNIPHNLASNLMGKIVNSSFDKILSITPNRLI